MLVLGVALLLGLAALSLTFTVTLDSLSARRAQEAALAEGQAEGGLALAALAVEATTSTPSSGGPTLPTGELGPWPDAGIAVVVDVVRSDAVIVLDARARVGRSTVHRAVTLETTAAGGLVIRTRY